MKYFLLLFCSLAVVTAHASQAGKQNLLILYPSWKICNEDVLGEIVGFEPEACECEEAPCCDTPSGGAPIRKIIGKEAFFCVDYSQPPNSVVLNGRINIKSLKPKLDDYYFLRLKKDDHTIEKIIFHSTVDCVDLELNNYYHSIRKHSLEDLGTLASEKFNCILKSDCDLISNNIKNKKQKQITLCRLASDKKLYVRSTAKDLNP